MDAASPGSDTNPFACNETQWRVFCLVTLLLFKVANQRPDKRVSRGRPWFAAGGVEPNDPPDLR